MSKKRIVVGMSGGVDSSLTAVLMREQDEVDVVGVTMKLWPCAETDGGFTREDACCSPTETIDARGVAQGSDIPHYVVDMEDEFRAGVVKDFLDSYERGETPNPCVRCNENVKFGDLWRYAKDIGADGVATGHYARIKQIGDRYCLAVPADRMKDQTYFLFSLTQEQLANASFPLGDYTKDEVRDLAREREVVTANKPESMDICFIGKEGVEGFLRRHIPDSFKPGPIKHVNGKELGQHNGLNAYTLGQRKGLGVAYSEPLYVCELDMTTDTVWLGPREAMMINETILRDCTWHLGDLPEDGMSCLVRNRYRAKPIQATIFPLKDNSARIVYSEPVPRPSPGQACVAYDDDIDLCLGGGWFVREEVDIAALANTYGENAVS